MCVCDAGWLGDTCEVQTRSEPCLANCTVHGACSTNGTCVCDAGWDTADCSVLLPGFILNVTSSCPSDCSGHGSCMPGGVCECDAGYLGSACELQGGDAAGVYRKCFEPPSLTCK